MARDRSDSEVIVSLRKLLLVIAIGWAACVLVMLIMRTALSAVSISASEYFAWTFLAGAPFVVAMLIVRSAMVSGSVAQVLQDAERSDSTSVEAVRERLRGMNAPPQS
jgi:hypothetical protein